MDTDDKDLKAGMEVAKAAAKRTAAPKSTPKRSAKTAKKTAKKVSKKTAKKAAKRAAPKAKAKPAAKTAPKRADKAPQLLSRPGSEDMAAREALEIGYDAWKRASATYAALGLAATSAAVEIGRQNLLLQKAAFDRSVELARDLAPRP